MNKILTLGTAYAFSFQPVLVDGALEETKKIFIFVLRQNTPTKNKSHHQLCSVSASKKRFVISA